jgi:2-alkyl-3-oxoalkanoate reductase
MVEAVALTGATGFIGRHLANILLAAGYQVRALARREDPQLRAKGVELWLGALDADLDGFVAESDAVVHVAGAVRAGDPRTFHAVNAQGTEWLAAAAASRRTRRFVLFSSLAARLPQLSAYAASKAAGEAAVLGQAHRMHVVVVRPPGLYGPEDRATLPLVRNLARGLLLHPDAPGARFSLLYAEDLAHLVLALLAEPPASGTILEPDDGRAGGYGWADLAAAAEGQLGRRVRLFRVPRAPLSAAAWLAEQQARWSGRPPILWRSKVAELYHRDWVSDTRAMKAVAGWRPRVPFGEGLVTTLAWYRAAGWL